MTPPVVLASMATQDRYDVSYWEAATVEAARALGATEVPSEAMRHGMDVAGSRSQPVRLSRQVRSPVSHGVQRRRGVSAR